MGELSMKNSNQLRLKESGWGISPVRPLLYLPEGTFSEISWEIYLEVEDRRS